MSTNTKGIIQAILTNDKLSEEEKSELIAEFIEIINEKYLPLKYYATKSDLIEVEIRVMKEIKKLDLRFIR